jgi:hypothetical protein
MTGFFPIVMKIDFSGPAYDSFNFLFSNQFDQRFVDGLRFGAGSGQPDGLLNQII